MSVNSKGDLLTCVDQNQCFGATRRVQHRVPQVTQRFGCNSTQAIVVFRNQHDLFGPAVPQGVRRHPARSLLSNTPQWRGR